MIFFGDALKREKIAKNVTLREMAIVTGKSIGYLSDVLQKRKGPPDSETIERLEELLGIKDKSLLQIALKERETKPSNLARRMKSRPRLQEALLRMEHMSDEDLEKVIEELPGNYLLFKQMKVEEGENGAKGS